MIKNLSRRRFLKGSLLSGGGLVLGFTLPMINKALARQGMEAKATYPVESWINVDTNGIVNFIMPASEMGQGSQTALAMILADEVGADYTALNILQPTNNRLYNNPFFGSQLTGGSTSVRAWWTPLRIVGATLRTMFIQVAASQWSVAEKECTTRNSYVLHKPSGKKLHFRNLIPAAISLNPPTNPKLRVKSEYQYIGKPIKRFDTPPKVTGEAIFGIDVVVDNMLIASVAQSPVFGGEVKSFDKAAALKIKGVKAVVPIDNGIAVVAQNYWQAQKGLKALKLEFTGGETIGLSSESIEKAFKDALDADDEAITVSSHGDNKDAAKKAHKTYRLDYAVPYLAHSTMEPMNATAHVTDDFCEIWAPTQSQSGSVQTAINITGLHADQIKVNTTYLGGGFGRRAEVDYVTQAVVVSEAVRAPVKLIWSREEDMQHDVYRPAAASRFDIGVDKEGYPLVWHNRVSNTSIMEHYIPGWGGGAPDGTMTEGAAETPYQLLNQLTDVVQLRNNIPVGFWRSVGNSLNCFFVESAIDELAHHAEKDPYEYRRKLLTNSRARGVLDAVAVLANWKTPLPKNKGRGIALTHSFGSYVAQVAEVSIDSRGRPKVDKVFCAIDCGIVINPSIVKRQMQSCIVYGLTAVLHGKINFKDGHVVESNFNDYPAISLADTPQMEVVIIDSNEKPGGYGEPGTPPVAPAVTNAIFNASGTRHRQLPIL